MKEETCNDTMNFKKVLLVDSQNVVVIDDHFLLENRIKEVMVNN